MPKDYEKQEVRDALYAQLKLLMNGALQDIRKNSSTDNPEPKPAVNHLYNIETHFYIMDKCWELLFPIEKERWPPSFDNAHFDKQMKWPATTTYNYSMSVLFPPNIPFPALTFGYAILDNKLIRSSFFVFQNMVKYQPFPQGFVVDPLAEREGITPSFYIGRSVEKNDIEAFMQRRNPLEHFVERTNKKAHEDRLFYSYLEAYDLQMFYHPELMPPQLIEFAKKNGMEVPPQLNRQTGELFEVD